MACAFKIIFTYRWASCHNSKYSACQSIVQSELCANTLFRSCKVKALLSQSMPHVWTTKRLQYFRFCKRELHYNVVTESRSTSQITNWQTWARTTCWVSVSTKTMFCSSFSRKANSGRLKALLVRSQLCSLRYWSVSCDGLRTHCSVFK